MDSSSANATQVTQSTVKLHFFYVTLILIGLLILLATQNWTKLDGFTDYLNVAATITSLVLGVLAIIYSFVSSNSTNNFLGSVEASAREMRSVGTDLRGIVSGGQELQARAEKRTDELHTLVGNLRQAVELLSTKTSEIAGAVETLPSQFGELRDEVRKRAQTESTVQSKTKLRDLWTQENISAYFSNSSLLGIVALKALVDAKSQGKYCDLKKLFNTDQVQSFEYVYGFLICATSAGIARFEYVGDSTLRQGTARSRDVLPYVATALGSEWERRASSEDDGTKRSIERYTTRIEESLVEVAG